MKFRNLGRFRTGGTDSHMELSVPPPKTPDGRIYRYSPNEKALPRLFVLGEVIANFEVSVDLRKRMKLDPRSNQTVCPYSGVIAADQDFTHPDDAKAAQKIVKHAIAADVRNAFHNMSRMLERSSSKSVTFKAARTPAPTPRPRFWRRDLLRELVCDHCGRDYGVFAIGLFCPDCGAPNLRLHFAREVQIVEQQVALADAQGGQEELAYRLMGNAHEDVLTAFEATLKAVYLYGIDQCGPGISNVKPVRNDFQNVERAQRRFMELAFDPFVGLATSELDALKLNIQKRHIIGHNLGIMDAKFADHAGGARIGETVHLVGEDIREFATFAQRVVDSLDAWLSGGTPAAVALPAGYAKPKESVMSATPKAQDRHSNLGVGELAARVGTWLVTQSKNGLADPIDDSALAPAFADVDQRSLLDAIAELKAEGYLTTTALMGRALPRMRATLDLFATFDPVAQIGDPVTDSLALIKIVLQGDSSVSTPDIHKQSGWEIRRFNPAIGLVIAQVDESHVSREVQNEYPSRHFILSADDRVALRRYAANLSR